jgi:hypothetical protein
MMKASTPIDGWSAYYALLTNALSAPPQARARAASPAIDPAPAVAKAPHRSFLERLDGWFADQRSRARERYLAESSDLCELETRMRELNRYY